MKYFFSIVAILFVLNSSGQQTTDRTLSPEESKSVLKALANKYDTAQFLRDAARNACKCIDSIKTLDKANQVIVAEVSKCIDEQSLVYQTSMKIYYSLSEPTHKIIINGSKSPEYQRYYFAIERWLKDSCTSMNRKIKTNDKESNNSVSEDLAARQQYNVGLEWMRKDSVALAAVWFQKAVNTDPQFAFAWDNLGICNRQLERYDEALYAYNQSLRVDPKGLTPLHNIPIVYEFQKKHDKAIEAYDNLLKLYPEDPEGYYGKGRVYTYFLVDLEKALRNMCMAYKMYIKINSPYRVDAEKNINRIYNKMKADGKEQLFNSILKEYKIDPSN